MAKVICDMSGRRVCWDLFKADAHQYGAHACWVKQSVKRLEFLRRSFCCLCAAQQSGGFSWGSYLRISCREEVISLPTYRSTGRGQSHLQCRSREAGRRGRKRRGGKGEEGERERRALHYTHSLACSPSCSDDKQKIQHASLWHKRAPPLKAEKPPRYDKTSKSLPLPQGLLSPHSLHIAKGIHFLER